MPRGPRLDQPGALHHVMARGIERRDIFVDDSDREDFAERLGRLASNRALDVYAWALMPNHVHLLVRTRTRSLASSMRSLLGGYATVYNRRHGRAGHLFQNRYKSVLCDEEAYFLTRVQYIHLNPVKAGMLGSVAELDAYPWTGHSTIVSRHSRQWQDVRFVLDSLTSSRADALRQYRKLVADGLASDRSIDLDGGGLRRSADGLEVVEALARGRECFRSDERILGRSAFTEAICRELTAGAGSRLDETPTFERLVAAVAISLGILPSVVTANGGSRSQAHAREALSFLWISGFGRSGLSLAKRMGVTPSAVYAAARRAGRERDRWLKLLDSLRAGRCAELEK
jgi:putative transposase